MGDTGQVLCQPVQDESGPVRLYHQAAEGAAPWELGGPVLCKCGGDRWNVEMVGPKFRDKDGYPSQRAKYTCGTCDGALPTHALPPAGG